MCRVHRLLTLFFFVLAARGQNKCLPCHRPQTQAYAATGMAHSISTWKSPGGELSHPFSNSRLIIQTKRGRMTHRIERNKLISEYPVALTIGSGSVGQSFAVAIGGHLYESPISWFSQRARWDVSPGYERDPAPDFDRRIEPECLNCHGSGTSQSIETFTPISCERCHFKATGHFTNPARMSAEERGRVCEGCHLQGEARILAPGSSWADRNPSFTTYVSSTPSPGLKVVSQVEQLALSKCARESSGELWCGSCHNPHGATVSFQQVCTGCHKAAAISQRHSGYNGECVSCHMPKQRTPEVAHTAYTDHRIQIPGRGVPVLAQTPRTLRAWREPPIALRDRNLGLAYIYAGQGQNSAEWIQQGFALLLPLPTKDAEVYSALGSVLLQKQRPKEAVLMYGKAERLNPARAESAHNLAVAELAAGDLPGAISQLKRAVSLDPYYERSWLLLTSVYTQLGQIERRTATVEQYLKLVPQNLTFRALQRQISPASRHN